jgi:hypothetical protein
MPWYKVTMSDEELLSGRTAALQDAFAQVFMMSGGPSDAGMFGGMNVGAPHVYYFSPGAARLAHALILSFSGIECDAPTRAEVAILVAQSGARRIPFRIDCRGHRFGVRVNQDSETVQVIRRNGDAWILDGEGHTRTYPSTMEIDGFVAPHTNMSAWHMAWNDLSQNNNLEYQALRDGFSAAESIFSFPIVP